jgi:two-component system LytT family response regulator
MPRQDAAISDICQKRASSWWLNFVALNVLFPTAMKKMTILIADKDETTRHLLIHHLRAENVLFQVKECSNGNEAIAFIQSYQPDLTFMGVDLPGKDGFEVIERTNFASGVVLMSSMPQDATRAFEYKVADYLLKPISRRRVAQIVRAFRQESEQIKDVTVGSNGYPHRIFVEKGNRMRGIPVEQITHLRADGDYTRIYTKDHQFYLCSSGIGQLESRFDPRIFMRVHRSYIVNIGCIEELYRDVSRYWLSLPNKVEISVGRNYLPVIRGLML